MADFVDLQRREERAQAGRESEDPRRRAAQDPLLLVGSGFVLGSATSYFYFHMLYMSGLSALLPFAAAVALLLYAARSLLRGKAVSNRTKIGSEKQLLMAIQGAGGAITPVEAALETSLTVDEAEEILTRFADRGHLIVQSQDGALLYALPGRSYGPGPRATQNTT